MMKQMRIIAALVLGFVISVGPSISAAMTAGTPESQTAPQAAAPRYEAASTTVRRATVPVKVDGLLDEAAWKDAGVLKIRYEYIPGDNIPAPVDADFLITFDENFLYMAFRCLDPDPSQIRAHIMDRDAIDTFIQDDHVTVMIDPFNDERRGFQFRVNPLGVQADANFSEMEGYEDFSWDAIWASAARIHDRGYDVEIAIPFSQLRFPKGTNPQTWGVSAERSYPRSVRHRMTSHMRRRNVSCLLCQFNKVTGFQGMKTGLNLEIDPTLTANRTDERIDFPAGVMEQGKIKADPGVSLRWGVTPNMILNAAVNPDFSQIEADVVELDVNRRFAIRYPEKRPFFMEGGDFFLTPIETVFSRTVADPAGGFKFTGKMGKSALGAFGTYDRICNLLFPSNQGSISYSSNNDVMGGVARYRLDIGSGSAVGALYTGRAGDDYHNHVLGLDGFFRLSDKKTLNFQYLRSETAYPSAVAAAYGQNPDGFGGGALAAAFVHADREWRYTFNYTDLSPGFRADFGYVPRVDFRNAQATLFRTIWGKTNGWFTNFTFAVRADYTYDYQDRLTDRQLSLMAGYNGPLQSQINLVYGRIRELYAGRPYDQNQLQTLVEIKPAGGFLFGLAGVFGDAIDYQNVRPASQIVLAPNAEIGLGRHLNINLRHAYQRLSFEGSPVFVANLSQVKLIYNFSVRLFVRAIVQYLDLDRNASRTNTLFTQFLFSYKLNPQTVLFLGYSDNGLGMTGIDLTQTNRTFFVKIGYAWLR